MEMARLERRAPALAATADIVTVADIGIDSCTDGSVEVEVRGGPVEGKSAKCLQIRITRRSHWRGQRTRQVAGW